MNLVLGFVIFMAGVVLGAVLSYCLLCAVMDNMPELEDDTIQPL